MALIFCFQKFLLRRLSSFGLSAVTLFAGLNHCVVLAAQQADVDNPRPAVFVASETAAPPSDSASQATATPGQPSNTNAPASQNQPAQNAPQDSSGQQTKRILGIIPNFRAISTDQVLPPQSVEEKFITCTEDSFDYSSIFIPAALAGYDMARRETPQFHQGAAGYARYFWHSAVDQTSENYMVEFIFPALTHEDSRYYTLGHGGFIRRTGYALSRAVITRTDSAKESFNLSEVLGSGMSAGLSNLYYPAASRSLSSTGTQWGLDVAIDAAAFWAKEFWPDINHRLFHNHDARSATP